MEKRATMPAFLTIYSILNGGSTMAVLLPTLAVKHVTDITPEMLHVMKVKGMILDVDNTLSRHGCPIPFEGSIEWTHEMRAAGIKVIIVSNNFKKRVSEFAAKYDLPYLYRAFKPLPKGYKQAMHYLHLPPKEIVVVGDQIFTDVLMAKRLGCRAFLVPPIQDRTDWFHRLKRRGERPFLRRYCRQMRRSGLLVPSDNPFCERKEDDNRI